MNDLKLEIRIRFSEKIVSDNDIQEVVSNVLNGLLNQVNELGIAPKESDTYVTFIEVNEPFSGANDEFIVA
jgi:hypothetical protein